MNRSAYSDDFVDDPLDYGRFRAQVASAIRGRRGQRFLRDLVEYLDGMPEKKLIAEAFQKAEGCCAAGAVGLARGIDLSDLNPTEDDLYDGLLVAGKWNDEAAARLDVASQLIREVEYVNDDPWLNDDDHNRWERVRAWALRNLNAESALDLRERGIDTTYGEEARP